MILVLLVLLDLNFRMVPPPVERRVPIRAFKDICIKTQRKTLQASKLTAGAVAIVPEIAVIEVALNARLFPHLADLRHAQLGVGSEEQLPCIDGEVVLLPVPEILELLVIKC